MAFQTNPVSLRELLNQAHWGNLQLPDFQRDYVWADDDVKSLIASVARGFPVGALLTLGTGGEVNFKPRLLEGVKKEREAAGEHGPPNAPETLLLDGQQRITSLYGALYGRMPMTVRKPKSERIRLRRFYYIDIALALSGEIELEEAIVGVPEDRIQRAGFGEVVRDLSSREKEFEAACFPLKLTLSDAAFDWIDDFRDHVRDRNPALAELGRRFRRELLDELRRYQMPVISLPRETSREAVCLVFEKVNVGGKKLDAFELVTAIFAGSEPPLDLRKDWKERLERIRRGKDRQGQPNPVFDKLRGFDFLQATSLAITHARRQRAEAGLTADDPDARARLPQISARREALLSMRLEDFRAHADLVEEGFRQAGRFLNEQRILWAEDIPYPAQVVELAALYAIGGRNVMTAAAREKLAIWFWRTSLAEDYGTSPESKLARDAEEISRWLAGVPEPDRLKLLTFNPDRLWSLRTRNSAAYKAFAALLMREGCRDFISGQPAEIGTFGNDPMDVHHIFPRAWCERNGISRDRYDSIVNKTPLTAASNRAIGSSAPSEYLRRIENRHGLSSEQLDKILRTHLIEPSFLRNDDFEGFMQDRAARLAAAAAEAMGRAPEELVPEVSVEPEEELPEIALDEEEAA
jgi:hypothetical protein